MISRCFSFVVCLLLLTVVLSGDALCGLVRVADGQKQSPFELPLAERNEEEKEDDDSDDLFVLSVTCTAKVFESLQKTSSQPNDSAAILIALHEPASPRAPPISVA